MASAGLGGRWVPLEGAQAVGVTTPLPGTADATLSQGT